MDRKSTRAPTAAQLEYCRVLRISVPAGATRTSLTRLIDDTKWRIVAGLIKSTPIRPGSVVLRIDHPVDRLEVVVCIGLDKTRTRFVDKGTNGDFPTCAFSNDQSPALNMTEVCASPAGWIHAYAVRFERDGMASDALSVMRQRFTSYMRHSLAPGERQRLEHGEYWSIAAVAGLRERFDAEHPDDEDS